MVLNSSNIVYLRLYEISIESNTDYAYILISKYFKCIVPFVALRILKIQRISHHSELKCISNRRICLFKYIQTEYAKYISLYRFTFTLVDFNFNKGETLCSKLFQVLNLFVRKKYTKVQREIYTDYGLIFYR